MKYYDLGMDIFYTYTSCCAISQLKTPSGC